MADGYKVRLGDGSEIGPMSLQAVSDWHRQKLIGPSSPVLRPGSRSWTTLAQVLATQAPAKSAAARTMPRPKAPSVAPRALGVALRVTLGALLVASAGYGAHWLFARWTAARPPAVEPVAVPTPNPMDALVDRAVEAAVAEVPTLTPQAVRILMSRSQAQVLEPDQLFRRSLDALTRTLPTLSAGEVKEVGDGMTGLYATLPGRDRMRLASYIDHVRAKRATTPQEDREMCGLMKKAFLQVSVPMRRRLQAQYEKAIRTTPRP